MCYFTAISVLLVSSLLRRRADARNVSYTPNPTDEKHTISTFVDQTRISVILVRLPFKKPSFPMTNHGCFP